MNPAGQIFLALMLTLTVCSATPPAHMQRIARDGNRLRDGVGNHFRHRGVSIEDPEVIIQVRGRTLDAIVEEVQQRFPGLNTIRAPLHPDGAEGCAGIRADPDAYLDNYVTPLAAICHARGLRLMLSYHAIGDWSTELLDGQVIPFWRKVLDRLGTDDAHIDLELFNEAINPADWERWRTTFAQPLVDWCNREAPALLPLIGSPRWNQYYPPEAAAGPVTGNYAYTIHTYPAHGTTAGDWENAFGHIADDSPVVCTEWGFEEHSPMGQSHLIGGMDYFRGLTSWLDVRGLGSVAWLYSSVWEPRMLVGDGETFSTFGAAARDYYQSRAMTSVDPVIHEGGWNITKPGSVSHGTVEVLNLELRAVSEIGMAELSWRSSSGAVYRIEQACSPASLFQPIRDRIVATPPVNVEQVALSSEGSLFRIAVADP